MRFLQSALIASLEYTVFLTQIRLCISIQQNAEPIVDSGVDSGNNETGPTASRGYSASIPVGHWRDSVWAFCTYGPLHCTVLNSCCCVPVAAGQLMTRLQLDHWGHPTTKEYTGAFRRLLYLALSFWVVRTILLITIAILDPNTETDEWVEPGWAYHIFAIFDDILAYVYYLFSVLLLRNVRSHVRSKYAIPESGDCPSGCEDTCCSLVCPCLVAAQMMRHTADYEIYGGRCCTETGLVAHAPTIV